MAYLRVFAKKGGKRGGPFWCGERGQAEMNACVGRGKRGSYLGKTWEPKDS